MSPAEKVDKGREKGALSTILKLIVSPKVFKNKG